MDIDMALLCLRATPIDHVLPSPAELLYDRKLAGNLPVRCTNTSKLKDLVRERLEHRQAAQKKHYDEKSRDLPPLLKDQDVYVQEQNGQWKPATVKAVATEPRSYYVEPRHNPGQLLRRNRRHLRESKTVKSTDSDTQGQLLAEPEPSCPSPRDTQSGPGPDAQAAPQPENRVTQDSAMPRTRSGRQVKTPARYKD